MVWRAEDYDSESVSRLPDGRLYDPALIRRLRLTGRVIRMDVPLMNTYYIPAPEDPD